MPRCRGPCDGGGVRRQQGWTRGAARGAAARHAPRRAGEEIVLGPAAARRAARRWRQQACEAALRSLVAAAALPGSWQACSGGRVRAPGSARQGPQRCGPACCRGASGGLCPGLRRRRLRAAASGPRLGAPAPSTPPAAPRQAAATTPTKLRKGAPLRPEGWQARDIEGKGQGDDEEEGALEANASKEELGASAVASEGGGAAGQFGFVLQGACTPVDPDAHCGSVEIGESAGKMDGGASARHFGFKLQDEVGHSRRQEGNALGKMEGDALDKHVNLTAPSDDGFD
ncbi:unnamed protein product [Prorocentrum cordatum]|uniref:Uncharacterized protein n=1 Tax=Prorocentrum cordatum TaxID=2364126 RepID=A0ABN9TYC0_9DINO|nr:unnamed protein product [Polarella glacialis]